MLSAGTTTVPCIWPIAPCRCETTRWLRSAECGSFDKSIALLQDRCTPVLVVIDVDSYPGPQHVVRPRELGWAMAPASDIASAAPEAWTCGSTFFIDAPTDEPLDIHDTAIKYVRDHLTGLPVNPTPQTFHKSAWPIYFSGDLLRAIGDLVETSRSISPRGVFIYKGGDEGNYLRATGLLTVRDQLIDLNFLSCPKFEWLMQLPHLSATGVSMHDCGHHTAVTMDAQGHGGIVHCPRVEAHVFGHWWACVGAARSAVMHVMSHPIPTKLIWEYADPWSPANAKLAVPVRAMSYANAARVGASMSLALPASTARLLTQARHDVTTHNTQWRHKQYIKRRT